MAIDFSFPDELQHLLQRVRCFCDEVVRPAEAEIREDAALTERLARMSGELDRRGADPAGRRRAWLVAARGRPVGLGFISAP